MQVSCPQCLILLQLSAEKLPEQPFRIQCPKCETEFTVSPPTVEASAPAPAEPPRDDDDFCFDDLLETLPCAPPIPPPSAAPAASPPLKPAQTTTLPPAKPSSVREAEVLLGDGTKNVSAEASMAVGWSHSMPAPTATDETKSLMPAPHQDVLQALISLLTPHAVTKQNIAEHRHRHLMACLATCEDVKKLQQVLEGHAYHLAVAQSSDDVTITLQSGGQLDILLLDPAFQADQQSSAAIMRCINMLNPARRRRLFVVVISQTYRSLDAPSAFAHGVNLIINSGDLPNLPALLAEGIQAFNNLYRAYNVASSMSPF